MSDEPCLYIVENGEPPKMSMMAWMATEGGRKCPTCGKYAKTEELGWVGVNYGSCIVDSFGHLPGFGCNRPTAAQKEKPVVK